MSSYTESHEGYLCVSGWGEDTAGIQVGGLTAGTGVASIADTEAVTTADLGDFSVLTMDSSAPSATFTSSLVFNPSDAAYDGKVTVALLGVRLKPMTKDTVMRCTLTAGGATYESAAGIYGQEMVRQLPIGTAGHEVFGSGLTSIVFHDLPTSIFGTEIGFEVALDSGTLDGRDMYIGSIFAGLQIPLKLNPRSFRWSPDVENSRFKSRGGVFYGSNGVVERILTFDAYKMTHELITGIGPDFYSGNAPAPNVFRAAIANLGQPMLFSPYPYPLTNRAWSDSVDDVNERLFSCQQNFWATYGLMERAPDISIDEFNDGLDGLYRGRFRFGEVR